MQIKQKISKKSEKNLSRKFPINGNLLNQFGKSKLQMMRDHPEVWLGVCTRFRNADIYSLLRIVSGVEEGRK